MDPIFLRIQHTVQLEHNPTEPGQSAVLRAQSLPGNVQGEDLKYLENKLTVPVVEREPPVMNWLPALQCQWKLICSV